MATPLTDEQVDEVLAQLPTWRLDGRSLVRELEFADFAEAFAYLTRVALVAQKLDHHPDMEISWARVTLRLSTHSAGALTELDASAARKFEELL